MSSSLAHIHLSVVQMTGDEGKLLYWCLRSCKSHFCTGSEYFIKIFTFVLHQLILCRHRLRRFFPFSSSSSFYVSYWHWHSQFGTSFIPLRASLWSATLYSLSFRSFVFFCTTSTSHPSPLLISICVFIKSWLHGENRISYFETFTQTLANCFDSIIVRVISNGNFFFFFELCYVNNYFFPCNMLVQSTLKRNWPYRFGLALFHISSAHFFNANEVWSLLNTPINHFVW